uniref:Uncharacterized protein n=1 Tax=Micrurus paraensis TaxID=1970185 RepID=A0A2D4JXP3_9SAUR
MSMAILSHPGHGCPKGAFPRGNRTLRFFFERVSLFIQEASSSEAKHLQRKNQKIQFSPEKVPLGHYKEGPKTTISISESPCNLSKRIHGNGILIWPSQVFCMIVFLQYSHD